MRGPRCAARSPWRVYAERINTISIGLLVFPGLTQLDATGPYEVFARIPGAHVSLVAQDLEPVVSEHGLALVPTARISDGARYDIVCVPGGGGTNALLSDDAVLDFLREQAKTARYMTSVCTGALVLGAAGLLDGYRATTHWLSHDLLPLFGAMPENARVVVDRSRITGGGITAGIDFALVVAAELAGEATARQIALMMEYDPLPPFGPGSPDSTPLSEVRAVRDARAAFQAKRRVLCEAAAARLR
jgi:cyclohexyl-isocyanide hydratase